MAADGLAGRAGDLAGAVGVDCEFPAQLVQQNVMVPVAPVLEPGQAGAPAVLAVLDMVRLAGGGRLITAAGMAAGLVP